MSVRQQTAFMASAHWIMRPRSMVEVVERTRHDGDWDHWLREFLDTFYLADGDPTIQASFIATEPGYIGMPEADAFLGGVGEHLARRWGLPIPQWVRDEARYLSRPMFVPDARPLRGYLIGVSPVSFRSRLIFTGPEPLQRARFPYHRGVLRLPLTYPVRSASADQPGPPESQHHPDQAS